MQNLLSIEAAIVETRRIWSAEPFDWGKANCDFSVGAYVKLLTGKDPSEPWRAVCRDRVAAFKLMAEAQGNDKLIVEGFERIGIRPAEGDPRRGDVVVAMVRNLCIPGIFLGPMRMFRSETGIFFSRRAPIVKVFRCV